MDRRYDYVGVVVLNALAVDRSAFATLVRLLDIDRDWMAASPFSILATASADGTCDASPKGDPTGSGGVYAAGCGDIVGSTYWNTFGGEPTDSSGPTGPYTFIVRVPGAAAVRLKFDNGKTRALPVGNGYTAGWLTHDETLQHPVLVGLSGDGAEIGTLALPLHSR